MCPPQKGLEAGKGWLKKRQRAKRWRRKGMMNPKHNIDAAQFLQTTSADIAFFFELFVIHRFGGKFNNESATETRLLKPLNKLEDLPWFIV